MVFQTDEVIICLAVFQEVGQMPVEPPHKFARLMADGAVGLVVDIAALLDHYASSRPSAAADAEAAASRPRRKVA